MEKMDNTDLKSLKSRLDSQEVLTKQLQNELKDIKTQTKSLFNTQTDDSGLIKLICYVFIGGQCFSVPVMAVEIGLLAAGFNNGSTYVPFWIFQLVSGCWNCVTMGFLASYGFSKRIIFVSAVLFTLLQALYTIVCWYLFVIVAVVYTATGFLSGLGIISVVSKYFLMSQLPIENTTLLLWANCLKLLVLFLLPAIIRIIQIGFATQVALFSMINLCLALVFFCGFFRVLNTIHPSSSAIGLFRKIRVHTLRLIFVPLLVLVIVAGIFYIIDLSGNGETVSNILIVTLLAVSASMMSLTSMVTLMMVAPSPSLEFLHPLIEEEYNIFLSKIGSENSSINLV